MAGCSKRLRGEAREISTSGGVLSRYVGARRLSATKHMSLFQQPALSPLIDRYRLLIITAHDAPVAVGFAADHHDVNLVGFEHLDHFVGRGLEFRRVGLLSESRSRVN